MLLKPSAFSVACAWPARHCWRPRSCMASTICPSLPPLGHPPAPADSLRPLPHLRVAHPGILVQRLEDIEPTPVASSVLLHLAVHGLQSCSADATTNGSNCLPLLICTSS